MIGLRENKAKENGMMQSKICTRIGNKEVSFVFDITWLSPVLWSLGIWNVTQINRIYMYIDKS